MTGAMDQIQEGIRGSPKTLHKALRALYGIIKSWFGLLILLMIYSVLGAYMFMELEGPAEKRRRATLVKERNYVGDLLWNLTQSYEGDPQSYDNWTQYVNERLPYYEKHIYEVNKYSSKEESWDFYGALLYCGTIYTTIGYGHVFPSTDWGRVATMGYGAIGVPIALIALADMGRHFTIVLKVLWVLTRKSYEVGACIWRHSASAAVTAGGAVVNVGRRRVLRDGGPAYKTADSADIGYNDGRAPIAEREDSGSPEVPEEQQDQPPDVVDSWFLGISGKTPTLADIDDQFNLPMGIAAIILVAYIFIGTLIFTIWEEWGYLEAFYFVFISLSTIGLGDIVPAHNRFFLLSSIYIFIGLSLVSMCINVAIQFFSRTMNKAKATMNEISDRAQRTATMTIGKAKTAVVKIAGNTDADNCHGGQNGTASDFVENDTPIRRGSSKNLKGIFQRNKGSIKDAHHQTAGENKDPTAATTASVVVDVDETTTAAAATGLVDINTRIGTSTTPLLSEGTDSAAHQNASERGKADSNVQLSTPSPGPINTV